MKRRFHIFASLWLCLLAGRVEGQPAAPDASARAIGITNEVWVGQQLVVVIELYAPGFFDSAPSFDFPDPPSLLLLPPTDHPVIRSQTIQGVRYTVQRYELSVFARQAGQLTVPPLTVKFQFKRNPLDHEAMAALVKTAPVSFVARPIAGAGKSGAVISARDLQMTETWQPSPGITHIKAGDAFTRTITFKASAVPGMLLPPFPTHQLDGLGIYPKPSEVLNHNDRGTLSGERRDIITYVCQQPGRWVIPAARLIWFDLDSQQVRTNELPKYVLDVLPNPALAAIAAGTNAGSAAAGAVSGWGSDWNATHLGIIGVVCLLLLVFFWRTRRFWPAMAASFRPVPLAPLNPGMITENSLTKRTR